VAKIYKDTAYVAFLKYICGIYSPWSD